MEHEALIRRTLEIARAARAAGNHPFGSLLAVDGKIVLEAENSVCTSRDVTQHAELALISAATKQLSPDVLARAVLYTSTEPCAMCAGAIYWAGISKIVFGCSTSSLAAIAGPGLGMPSREIYSHAARHIDVIGPVIERESVEVHDGFWHFEKNRPPDVDFEVARTTFGHERKNNR